MFIVTVGLIAATTAFRCPGPEPAATSGDLGGGGAGVGGTGGADQSSGSCGDTLGDKNNCGACGHVCSEINAVPGSATCVDGLCQVECQPPWVDGSVPLPPDQDDGCESPPKLIFLSDYMGPGALMGLSGADLRCDMVGKTLVPTSTFKAWMSDSTLSAEARLSHHLGWYWLPPDQEMPMNPPVLVAIGWDDLTDGTLLHGIDRNIFGATIPGARAWTGTQVTGAATTNTCMDWNGSTSALGTVGSADAVDGQWTDMGTPSGCADDTVRLYCIEQ
ncbi:MAG: hypothetical protein U0414_38475 [Polyangiaceae bacterium]